MAFILVVLAFLANLIACATAPFAPGHTGSQPICVSLNSRDSVLNRHLCETIGLSVCDSAVGALSVNSAIVRDAPDRERCLQTLFGLYAALACRRSSPASQHIYRPAGGGPSVAYVCSDVCKAIWKACSPRSGSPFADIIAEEESKSFCKNVALKQSEVQIRQARDDQCVSKIIPISEADVAEINWLMGGKVNWHFIKLKGVAIAIISVIALLALATVYTKIRYTERRRRAYEQKMRESESESFLELNVNMY